ncbi:MAG: hypothetical protein OHK0053_12170 [Microscillaceae bacterium]
MKKVKYLNFLLLVVFNAPSIFFYASAQEKSKGVYFFREEKIEVDTEASEIFITFKEEPSSGVFAEINHYFSSYLTKPIMPESIIKGGDFYIKLLLNEVGKQQSREILDKINSYPSVLAAYPAYSQFGSKVYADGKVLIYFNDFTDLALLSSFIIQSGSQWEGELNLGKYRAWVIRLPKGHHNLFELGLTLSQNVPGVFLAQPNFISEMKNHYLPNDSFFNSQWFLNQISDADIDAPEAWDLTTGSSSIVVGVLDGDGYDVSHPDFVGKLSSPYDAVNDNNNPSPILDFESHGTPCAGLVAGATDNSLGVASVGFNIRVCPIRIGFNQQESGSFSTSSEIIARAATHLIALEGVVAVSNSYSGGNDPARAISYEAMRTQTRGGLGAVILASTGNSGELNNEVYPCYYPFVVGVGASSSNDEKADFSNYGDSTDVVAPGVSTLTIDNSGESGFNGFASSNNYTFFNGTSAACPVAAGVVGLIASVNPNLNERQLTEILLSTCDKRGSTQYTNTNGYPYGTWNELMGYGRVNAFEAVQQALSTVEPGTRIISLSGTLAFGNIDVNQQSTKSFTISNLGDATLTIFSITAPVGYTLNWDEGQIPAGGSQEILVTFSPTAPQDYNGVVNISSNRTEGPNTLNITGKGTNRVLSLSGNLAFGEVEIGQSKTAILSIRNLGNQTLNISSIVLPENFTSNWNGGNVISGITQNVIITFTPVDNNEINDIITVNGNQTAGNNTINVSGVGTGTPLSLFPSLPSNIFSLFPNPVQERMSIDLSQLQGKEVFLSIVNAVGQYLFTQKVAMLQAPLYQLDVQHLNPGLYFLVISESGKKAIQPFIKD